MKFYYAVLYLINFELSSKAHIYDQVKVYGPILAGKQANSRIMEAGLRYSDKVAGFFRFRRDSFRIELIWSSDTGIVFLLPNPFIF